MLSLLANKSKTKNFMISYFTYFIMFAIYQNRTTDSYIAFVC